MDEKKIRELIEEEVQKRVKEEKEKIRKEVKSEIQEEKDKNSKAEGMSRRSFLRKLGAGTLGLGALSFLPASALNVRSDGFSFYGGSGSGLDFDVDNSGNIVDIGDFATGSSINFQDGLTVSGNTVWHAGNDGSGSGLDADTVDGKDAKDIGGVTVAYSNNSKGYVSSGSTKYSFDIGSIDSGDSFCVVSGGVDLRNESGSGAYPGIGLKISVGGNQVHSTELGDEVTVSRYKHRSGTVGVDVSSVTGTLTVSFYGWAGGGGSNDRVRNPGVMVQIK